MLIDTFGRVATDLRVSLTDRCNVRRTYCMAEEGLRWPAKPDPLTDDEIVQLIRIAVTELGVGEVRLTGGESLLRPGIVERCAALAPRPKLSLTTNGIGLKRTAAALKTAGLDRVNASPDTLRPAATMTPVKVNAVLMPGPNADAGTRTACPGHGERLQPPVHRADAARRPARLEARRHDHCRGHPGETCAPASRSTPRRTRLAAPRPPSAGSSTAGPPGSASSPPSPAPAAVPATAPGSPPTARCAPGLFAREEINLRAALRS